MSGDDAWVPPKEGLVRGPQLFVSPAHKVGKIRRRQQRGSMTVVRQLGPNSPCLPPFFTTPRCRLYSRTVTQPALFVRCKTSLSHFFQPAFPISLTPIPPPPYNYFLCMSICSNRFSPFVGLAVGVFGGIATRALLTSPFDWRQVLFSATPLSHVASAQPHLLRVVNQFKQIEMKGFLKCLSPLYPAAAAACCDRKVARLNQRQWLRVGVGLVGSATLVVLFAVLRDRLGMRACSFNASGHLVVATVLSWYRYEVLGVVQGKHSEQGMAAACAITWAYSLTDAILMFNTATRFHSTADLLAGGMLGAACCLTGTAVASMSRSANNKT